MIGRTVTADGAVGWSEDQGELRRVFDDNPHPMFVFARESLLAANRAAVLLYGYSRDEFLAMAALRSGMYSCRA